ncbi:MAG: ATP-binding protein [Oscillospiraceae bacterium]|nr:ATP-binding protein [Oscillospiraceae bacterium]
MNFEFITEKLDAMPVPMFLLKDGVILHGNDAAARLFGTTWCGHELYALFDADLVPQLLRGAVELYSMFSRNEKAYDLRLRPEGEYFVLEFLPDAGKLSSEAFADLLQSISIKLLELLQSYNIRAQDANYMRQFTRLARHIGDLAQFENKNKQYMPILSEAQAYIETFSERLTTELSMGRIRILSLEDVAPMELDTMKLDIVLYNLLTNALKASPYDAEIVVRPWIADEMLHISVEDKGPGFDFSRHRTTTQAKLGLELVDRIIKLMGGQWEKRNRPEGGAYVAIHLPMKVDIRIQQLQSNVTPLYDNGAALELLRLEMAAWL